MGVAVIPTMKCYAVPCLLFSAAVLSACLVDSSGLSSGNAAGGAAGGTAAGAGGNGPDPQGGDTGLAGERDQPAGAGGAQSNEGGMPATAGSAGSAGSAGASACRPKPETCNGSDDDCDGKVDNGCSYALLWSPAEDTKVLGSSVDGSPFSNECAADSVLTGMRVGMGNKLAQLSGVCRAVILSPAAGSATTPQVMLGARADLPLNGSGQDASPTPLQDLLCGEGQVVVGAAVKYVAPQDPGSPIAQLALRCAPIIVRSTVNGPALDFDADYRKLIGPIACTACSVGQPDVTVELSAGRLVSELFGASGFWVDRFGFGTASAKAVAH